MGGTPNPTPDIPSVSPLWHLKSNCLLDSRRRNDKWSMEPKKTSPIKLDISWSFYSI